MTYYEPESAIGPNGGLIHYIRQDNRSYCSRPAPKSGWVITNDEDNNRNVHGFCPVCMKRYAKL